jgi:hypothetical protein
MENFLHWVVGTCTIKKTSTVTTYWRQLSQLHITWWQCRLSPQTLKEIFVVWPLKISTTFAMTILYADSVVVH